MKKFLLPFGILAAGAATTGLLFSLGGEAEVDTHSVESTPIQVMTLASAPERAQLSATGVVKPAQQVVVIPQVTGQVIYISDALLPGGRFEKGEVIARIDARDYHARAAAEESNLRQAELNLALEESRQIVATREWELLGSGEASRDLALRKPHLAAASQNLTAARSGMEKAWADVGRTALTSPFNALVLEESLDVGQVVGSGTHAATMVGTDYFWVQVSIPLEYLALLQVPGVGGFEGSQGSAAEVVQTLPNGQTIERDGYILRLGGQLDPETRTASLTVAVENPLSGPLPLLPGAFVETFLNGETVEQAFGLPRTALYEGDRVWLVSSEGTLEERKIRTDWGDSDTVVVTEGLQAGERVVTSPLSLPIAGMPVTVIR